ncbi:hypothetical protein ABVT39_015995 [Epinephelus coioides]
MASNYLKDWRRKRARIDDFLDDFANDEDVSQEDTQEEGGAGQSGHPPDETLGTTSFEAQHLEDTQEGRASQSAQLTDETLGTTSFDTTMEEESDTQEDYGYREYSDTSDLESQTEEELLSLREDVASWAVDTKQTHSTVNKILAILRKHGHNLPKDVRSLLQTPCFVESKKKCDGDYIYYGLESGIRNLLHLYEDVEGFKCSLNDISAFPFENHLQSIKRMVRNGQNPIAQVTKRIVEKEQAKPIQTLSHKRYYVSAKTRDSCFILEDEIAFVREKRADGKLVADVVTLDDANDLFEKPYKSKIITIAYVDRRMDQAHRRLVDKREVMRKAVCIPHSEGFAIFPLLHTMD